jgi:hypothetical protein
LLKNGATPNFVEFKDENENVVASISTSGDLNVAGSVTVNGVALGGGGSVINTLGDIGDVNITSATPNQLLSYSGSEWENISDVIVPGTLDVTGELSAATPSFTGPTTVTGSLIVNGSTVPTITVSSEAPSGGVDGDVWLVQY